MKNLIIALLFVSPSVTLGQDWNFVGKTVAGHSFYIRSNPSSTYQVNFSPKCWVKKIAPLLKYYKGNKTYTVTNGHELTLSLFDCLNRRMKMVSITIYNSKGVVVYSKDFEDFEAEWTEVVPESMGEALLNHVCPRGLEQ